MDALTALWFTSIVGAVGFTATGYFFARSRMPEDAATPQAEPKSSPPSIAPSADTSTTTVPSLAMAATSVAPPHPALAPDEPDVLVQDPPSSSPPPVSTAPAPNVVSRPPQSILPRRDPRREDGDDERDHETEVLLEGRAKRASSAVPAKAAPMTQELERQLHALRVELRAEVVARNKIETHARELAARLSTLSEAATRHPAPKGSSIIPPAASDAARSRLSGRAPGLFAEIDSLKVEVARLTAENESLRATALQAPPPRVRPKTSRTDLVVPQALARMVERIAQLDNVRAAVVAESSGLVLAGSGELADALAAFGAYMSDAATRSERLLPLRVTQEVSVRDSQGLVFSTRVLGRPQAELALVTLAMGDVSVRAIREIVDQTPGLDADAFGST